MLDMGFIRDIRMIVDLLPRERQTLFFSATMPSEIVKLAGTMLSDPVRVAVTPPATTVERIAQRVIHIDRGSKPALLAEILGGEGIGRVLVFTRTKHGADKVVRGLEKAGIASAAIHGNKSQGQRERALALFREGRTRTLVATDIAARGIDVDGISHVVNFDLPNVPETYVHRIGRTARAGNEGIAISLCAPDEAPLLRDIEKAIRLQIPSERRGSLPVVPDGERPQRTQRAGHRPDGNRKKAERPKGGRPPRRSDNRPRFHGVQNGDDIAAVHFLKQSPEDARAKMRTVRAG
jgi:superfamily II DNA/RNA helicase